MMWEKRTDVIPCIPIIVDEEENDDGTTSVTFECSYEIDPSEADDIIPCTTDDIIETVNEDGSITITYDCDPDAEADYLPLEPFPDLNGDDTPNYAAHITGGVVLILVLISLVAIRIISKKRMTG